jgi:hypothetical protein
MNFLCSFAIYIHTKYTNERAIIPLSLSVIVTNFLKVNGTHAAHNTLQCKYMLMYPAETICYWYNDSTLKMKICSNICTTEGVLSLREAKCTFS